MLIHQRISVKDGLMGNLLRRTPIEVIHRNVQCLDARLTGRVLHIEKLIPYRIRWQRAPVAAYRAARSEVPYKDFSITFNPKYTLHGGFYESAKCATPSSLSQPGAALRRREFPGISPIIEFDRKRGPRNTCPIFSVTFRASRDTGRSSQPTASASSRGGARISWTGWVRLSNHLTPDHIAPKHITE